MDNKIKVKIESLKKDKSSFKEYIANFCNINKANELFKNNKEFKNSINFGAIISLPLSLGWIAPCPLLKSIGNIAALNEASSILKLEHLHKSRHGTERFLAIVIRAST